jgi:hypothetical protein
MRLQGLNGREAKERRKKSRYPAAKTCVELYQRKQNEESEKFVVSSFWETRETLVYHSLVNEMHFKGKSCLKITMRIEQRERKS